MNHTLRNRGFSLLEVLIALLIFSLGLLGVAGLMVVSVKTNQVAYLRTQASFLAQSMSDRMRANIAVINDYNGDYNAGVAGTGTCQASACTPAQLVEHDKKVWSKQLTTFLPAASANIACNGASVPGIAGAATYNGLCTFTIKWREADLARVKDADLNQGGEQTFAWVFQP